MKVTNYEISKRLDELGFKCESHCGWWAWDYDEEQYDHTCEDISELLHFAQHVQGYKKFYQAYDCWDLLMFIKDHDIKEDLDLDFDFYFSMRLSKFRAWWDYAANRENIDDSQPQNALGLAVIKILEENKNE